MGIFFSLFCRLREEQPFKKDLRVRLFNNKNLAQVEFCRTSEQRGRTTLCKLHLKIPTQSTDHTVSFCVFFFYGDKVPIGSAKSLTKIIFCPGKLCSYDVNRSYSFCVCLNAVLLFSFCRSTQLTGGQFLLIEDL